MSRDCVIVDRGMSLKDFVDIYLLKTGQRCFAVEDQGRLVGIITPFDVSNISRDRWDETTVREAMRPLQELHVITPDTPVLDALKLMARNDVNQLPVVANGTLQGMVSRSHLVQLLQVRSVLQLPATYRSTLQRRGEELRRGA
jgi:CBS domain-containing protein